MAAPAIIASVPEGFVWSKMGAESGQGISAIIRRKEYERQLGAGVFAWGIGNALGTAVADLAAAIGADPLAIFSPMRSKAKVEDATPSSVVLWTGYEDARGAAHELPAHLLITSRGLAGGVEKTRHYALFCFSPTPILDAVPDLGDVTPAALRNFATGTQLGASQVTAVVRHHGAAAPGARAYPVAFVAQLSGIRYARLRSPRVLSVEEISRMEAAAASLDAWRDFVADVRRHPVPRAVPQQEQLEIGYAT